MIIGMRSRKDVGLRSARRGRNRAVRFWSSLPSKVNRWTGWRGRWGLGDGEGSGVG